MACPCDGESQRRDADGISARCLDEGPGIITGRPTCRWAIEDIETGGVIGAGQILGLQPEHDDLDLGYQLAPQAWGRGLGSEAGHALAHYAFTNGEEEVFAVVRPNNHRGIRTARRIGMEWVGETDKYFSLRL